MRRKICQSIGALFGATSLVACAQPEVKKPERNYTEDEQRRMHKFRGVKGAEWYLSSVHELSYVEIRDQMSRIVDAPSKVSPGSSTKFSISLIPISLKTIWREQDTNNPIYSGNRHEQWSGGKIVANFEIPVADRIPDELLDDLRRDPKGMLRIKIRLHREGVLLGWDIQRIPNPLGVKREERLKRHLYLPYAYTHTGGDFKEARSADYLWDGAGFKGLPNDIPAHRAEIHYAPPWRFENLVRLPSAERLGGVVPKAWAEQGLFITSAKDVGGENREKGALYEKGWYMHPKTGQRIETDF